MKIQDLFLFFHSMILVSVFVFLGYFVVVDNVVASQTCNRCSNQRGCSLATFQSDDGCQNPVAGSTPSYSKLDACGPNVAEGADNTWCTVPMGPTCTRCSNKIGCTMATFQSTDNCYNPASGTTPSYSPNTNPCGPVPATPENPNPDNSKCVASVAPTTGVVATATPTPTPAPKTTNSCQRCSNREGCSMAKFQTNNTCNNATEAAAAIPIDGTQSYDPDVTCGMQNNPAGTDATCDSICPALRQIYGKDNVQFPITVNTAGTYYLLFQIMSLGDNGNAFYVQVDNTCPIVVGNANTIPAHKWSWVDFRDGDSSKKITTQLTAGAHTLKIVPMEPGVKFTKIRVVNHPCVPNDQGYCSDEPTPTDIPNLLPPARLPTPTPNPVGGVVNSPTNTPAPTAKATMNSIGSPTALTSSPTATPVPTATPKLLPKPTVVPTKVPTPTPTQIPTPTSTPMLVPLANGLTGYYFANTTLTGAPVSSRLDKKIDFDWGQGSPVSGISSDKFSVRWVGKIYPTTSGTYKFYITVNDGGRLWVDNKMLIDTWTDKSSAKQVSGSTYLSANKKYDIRFEYYENAGSAQAKLWWLRLNSFFIYPFIIPSENLFTR